ncbi:hypothetical protein HGRIS_005751 [Hohenbuehelia grisea]|uniref:Cytochrome P450 n=1 Tax=Hohenbuehelia grisea TaxID=104357 RepID=A0ABR3JYV0_9AGAR
MTMHPGVLKKAQVEIDTHLRNERLPTFDDREHLPYFEAVLLEVLRLHVILPTALPHVTSADDVYDGYFIPRGSIILANVWNYLRNENTYDSPMDFHPERFLSQDGRTKEKDPRDYMFGFGRRQDGPLLTARVSR